MDVAGFGAGFGMCFECWVAIAVSYWCGAQGVGGLHISRYACCFGEFSGILSGLEIGGVEMGRRYYVIGSQH